MMIEFEDHGEEEQRLLLQYLERMKGQSAGASPLPPEPGWFWRLVGRLWLWYVRWRYGRSS